MILISPTLNTKQIEISIQNICDKLGIPNDDDVIHAYASAFSHNLRTVFCIKVQGNYYQLPLEQRMILIGPQCKSISQLTKCLLYENKCAPENSRDIAFSRYYLIIYQYIRKFSEPKFHMFVKHQKDGRPEFGALTKQSYKYQYADEQVAKQLLSSEVNGMSPIGLTDMKIPMFIDKNIQDELIFVGGLHEHVKARVSVKELIQNYQITIFEFTDELREE